jgi:predicted metal-binding membrane protein
LAGAAVAWVAVVRQSPTMTMPGMSTGMSMSDSSMDRASWSVGDAIAFVGSWGVMMAAMMLPSATPMIALYATVGRRMAASGRRTAPVVVFALPYAVVWLAAGIPVYAGTVLAADAARSHSWLSDAAPYAVAAVLVAAGAYQFNLAKRVCLRQCRSPLPFLAARWRPGLSGAARVGLAHAGYCLGCCWLLMIVLVTAGAMGLAWVLLVAALVFLEKITPRERWATNLAGAALLALGIALALHPTLATSLRS